MYVVREVFTAKPGQAGKLAKLFKKTLASQAQARVLTDLIGNYNTVVMEFMVASLADYEKLLADYKSGKLTEGIDQTTAEEMSRYSEMYQSGRREVLQVVE
ncbi:MAG: hypothetical protein Q8Q23_03245 [bacterium]|nr:hypothetical protein [bacterium]